MKHSLFTLFLITLLCIFSITKNKTKNSLTEKHLNGKVKTLSESLFKVLEKYGEIQKGRLAQKEIYKYDNKGNLIEWDMYRAPLKISFSEKIQMIPSTKVHH